MLTYKKLSPDCEAHYLDPETRQKYRRVLGGLGWPQKDKPGCALVLAETLGTPPNYRVLAAVTDHNGLVLLQKAKAMEIEFPVTAWHGNHANLLMVTLVYEFNQGKYLEDKLKFTGAPMAGEKHNSGYYLPRVIELGKSSEQTLTVDARTETTKEVLAALSGINPGQLNDDIAIFPLLAAVCYPLSFLMTYKAHKPSPAKTNLKKRYGADAWQL